MNYGHSLYKNNKTLPNGFMNSEEAAATYIRAAAKYIRRSCAHIQANEIEERSDVSDKACLLLSGIVAELEENTPEQKKVAASLKSYFKTMIELILKMNMLNDLKLAQEIAQQLERLAISWEDLAQKKAQIPSEPANGFDDTQKENSNNLSI